MCFQKYKKKINKVKLNSASLSTLSKSEQKENLAIIKKK